VVLENDLVDKLKPGDRVEVTGVYRCVPGMNTGSTNGVFKPVLVATGAKNIMHDKEKPIMTD
jgi:DNA replication licensing factor MCM3